MANIFEKILKAIASSPDPMMSANPANLDKAITERATKRAEQRNATRTKLGITTDSSNFWKKDEKARERYKTLNPLAEEELRKKYPNITDEQLNQGIDNRAKRDIMKRSTHPEVKKLYDAMFDKDGNFTTYGKQNWQNVDDMMAQIAMDNDIDGLSDERENRKGEEWYNKWGKSYLDAFDPYTTMRQAAKKYLDETAKDPKNAQTKTSYFNILNQEGIDGNGRSRQDRIKDFDNLASSVSQDYNILMNYDDYKDLQEYDRLKDIQALKLNDIEKLNLYALFYTDYNRGGEKYAKGKLAEYFKNRLADNQTAMEKVMNWGAGFQDDVASFSIQTAGIVLGLLNMHPGYQTEEDRKRREGQSWWQGIFDNPLVQYGNDLMETHVYDTNDQRRMKELGLQDNQFYKTAEQEESLFSLPDFLQLTSNYGFTAATSMMSLGTTGLARGVVGGSLKLMKGLGAANDAARWSKVLKGAVKAKDAINVGLGGAIATAEGAGITLENKVQHYHDGIAGLQNKYFEQWVKDNPVLAAATLRQMGNENVPSGNMQTSKEGGGRVVFSNKDINQMIDQFNQVGDNPQFQQFKQSIVYDYEQAHPEQVAADYQEIQDRVEDAATAEFAVQSLVNGVLNHTLKNTLNAKPLQQARKNVARRMGLSSTDKPSDLAKRVTIEQAADGSWAAKAVKSTPWKLAKERIKESKGEMLEEGLQDVGGAFGTGYYDYAYQDYINSRFGDKDGVNSATNYTVLDGILSGLGEAAKSTINGETIQDALYGGLSSAIGGPNINTNFRNRKQAKEANQGAGWLGSTLSNISNYSPITIRGAWTPFINSSETNLEQQRNNQLAQHLNDFFKDKTIQEKLTSAGGINSFIKQYNDAIESGDNFFAKNAKFGSTFSIANMLDKLQGTAYYDMITRSLDKREALDFMSDEQIKEALEDTESDASKALREYKTDTSNLTGDETKDHDFSASDENVDIVRKIAKNANQLKTVLNDVSEKREQILKDFGASLDDDAMDAILYQQLSISNKQERIKDIDAKLQAVASYDENKQAQNTSKKAIAKYGSLENLKAEKENLQQMRDGFQKALDANQKLVDAIIKKKSKYRLALNANKGKETDAIRQLAPTQEEEMILRSQNAGKERLAQANSMLKRMERQEKALSKAVEHHIEENRTDGMLEQVEDTPVLSEQDIMEMDAASRAFILSEKNKSRYSEAQQEVIDALNAKGRDVYGKDWDRMLEDRSRLEHQVNKDIVQLNNMQYDSKALLDYVNVARVAKLKRERTNRYEVLFRDANEAIDRYEEGDLSAEDTRRSALSKLAEFLYGQSDNEDNITSQVKQELKKKYSNTEAMRMLNEHGKALTAFSEDMDKVDVLEQEEIQQTEDSSVSSSDNQPSKRVTVERDITANDRSLIDYALTYSASRMIPLDELSDAMLTDDFRLFVQQQNERYEKEGKNIHVDLDPMDAQRLMQAAVNLHHELNTDREEKRQKEEEEKQKIKPAQSAPVKPVIPTEKAEEKKPERKEPEKPKPQEEPQDDDREVPEDLEIGVDNLLYEIDRLDLEQYHIDKDKQDNVRETLRNAVLDLAKSGSSTVRAIQEALVRKFITNGTMSPIVARLLGLRINTQERTNTAVKQTIVPFELETQDLNAFPEDGIWGDYITAHHIAENFNQVSNALHKEGKDSTDVPAMFLYDPALTAAVAQSMGDSYTEDDIPIILVIPVTEQNKRRFGISDDQPGLIDVGKNNFGHTAEKDVKYMPIGIMPKTGAKNLGSSIHMKSIRSQVDTGIAVDGKDSPHVLRYRTGNTYPNGNPKENGTRITANITIMDVGDSPEANREVPLREMSELGAESITNPDESIVQHISEKDKKDFNEARDSGDRKKLRATNLYKAIRKAILRNISRTTKDKKDGPGTREALEYNVPKGNRAVQDTKGQFNQEIIIKPFEETTHRDNPERKVIDIIREFNEDNDNSSELIGNGSGDNGGNSRITGLFHALKNLLDTDGTHERPSLGWPIDANHFTTDGKLKVAPAIKNAHKAAMADFAKTFKRKLDNYIDIADVSVDVTLDKNNPVDEKTMTITIKSNGENIASITLRRGEAFEGKHLMSLLRQCVLDADDNIRMTTKGYGLVKWQVNFQNAGSEKRIDVNTYNNIYDDGILTVRLSKLTYRPKSVRMSISSVMREHLFDHPEPDATPSGPTGRVQHETRSGTGTTVDTNSGMVTKPSSADITVDTPDSRIPSGILKKLKDMLIKSTSRQLTDDEKAYSIGGRLFARVTSIKRFFPGSRSEKFDENSPWVLPSTSIGNSLDGFGRDVFNNLFDGMDEQERREIFDAYPNSTGANYEQVYQRLKSIQANLAAKGQTILAIGNADNPGSIVAAGTVNVKTTGGIKPLNVAGTLDVLAVDTDGNLHIYDFKTYRSEAELNEEKSQEKDYDIQLSLYAKFLEDEYGLRVASINIIPVHVNYPSPTQSEYQKEDPGSDQLLIKNQADTGFSPFREANFQVKNPFSVTRVTGDALTAGVDKMTAEEKQWVAESLGDQHNEPVAADDIQEAGEPEQSKEEQPQLESPTTMTEAEIRRELSSLGEPKEGVSESDTLIDRRNALKVEQQRRQQEVQELESRFPVGTQVNSSRYGNGTVVKIGVETYSNALAVKFDNGDTYYYFSLGEVEDDLDITDVPIESLDNNNPVTEVKPVQSDEYDEDSEEEEGEDEEDDGGIRSRSAKIFGNSAPPVQSDWETVKDSYNSEDKPDPVEEQELRCRKKL